MGNRARSSATADHARRRDRPPTRRPYTVDGCRGRSCERCCRADLSRVITLAANTGRRGSDLIRMSPTDIETFKSVEGINVVQRKTDRQVWVPITSPLARTMVAWERRRGPFLTHLDGRPWKRKALTMAWDRHREHNKDLGSLNERGLVLPRPTRNGVRAAAPGGRNDTADRRHGSECQPRWWSTIADSRCRGRTQLRPSISLSER